MFTRAPLPNANGQGITEAMNTNHGIEYSMVVFLSSLQPFNPKHYFNNGFTVIYANDSSPEWWSKYIGVITFNTINKPHPKNLLTFGVLRFENHNYYRPIGVPLVFL